MSPASYDAALVFWEKPYGDKYGYEIVIQKHDRSVQWFTNQLGRSATASAYLDDLDPISTLTIVVRHQCTSNDGSGTDPDSDSAFERQGWRG